MRINNWFFPRKRIKHTTRGDFAYQKRKPIKMLGGGHTEENLIYLRKHRLRYGIDTEFDNGVRLGNIQNHSKLMNTKKNGHAWFPREWSEHDVIAAASHVMKLKKNQHPKNHVMCTGRYRGVSVGVYCNNGHIDTVFPDFYINKGAKKKSYAKY